jgi:tetratricopeptide (TPR) repeat protein
MRKSRVNFSLSVFFVVCAFQALSSCAWGQGQAAPTRERQISEKDAIALEEGLNANPDNLIAREQLIRYYFEATLTSHGESEIEEKREKHIFWLIEHHPESQLAGSPEADIMPMEFNGSADGYQHGKQLWLQEVEKHPDNQQILSSAAQFVSLFDRKVGRDLLDKVLALDPGNFQASSQLAQSYMLERETSTSPDERLTLAQKALSIRERGLERADARNRFYGLSDLASSAFDAGEIEKAQQYASELLRAAPEFKSDWNYGNALYYGNIVLGRIALKQGDIVGAKEHLLAASQTPGSPQLNSFGPNMTLAKDLVEKNEREVVLTYLQSCGKFWKMDNGKSESWMATIRGGGTPDFGANLIY